MYNGNGEASDPGAYNYWDREYDGIGSVSGLGPKTSDHEYLSGGTGNLTDGVIPSSSFHLVENIEGTGPYVGWLNYNPVITFHFTSLTTIDTVNVFVDDSDGYGGVNLPSQVDITMGGITRTFVIPELDGAEPKTLTFSSLGLHGHDLKLLLTANNYWVFASEVTFDGVSAVPVPASLLLVATGLLGLALGRQRRG